MLARSLATLERSAAAAACRAQSTAVAPAAARPAVLTTAQAVEKGLVVTPSWARFNVGAKSKSWGPAEARHQPALQGVASGMQGRVAIVHRVSPSAMSSGPSASRWWTIRFSHVNKWSNPLMGWVSSADTQSPVSMHVRFETPEQAILFCERNGWSYEVNPGATASRVAGTVDNMYQYNFVPRDVATQMKALGPRRATKIFANDKAGTATWVNFRRTQFGTEPWRPADYQTTAAWTGNGWPGKKEIPIAEQGH